MGAPDLATLHVCGAAVGALPPPGGVGDRGVPATAVALVAQGVFGDGVSGVVDGAGSTARGGGHATLTLGLARIGGGEAGLEPQTKPC